jgi:hypothetical protein
LRAFGNEITTIENEENFAKCKNVEEFFVNIAECLFLLCCERFSRRL